MKRLVERSRRVQVQVPPSGLTHLGTSAESAILMRGSCRSATARASFAFYNTLEEVDRLAISLEKIRKMMA